MFRWEFIHEQGAGDSERADVFPVWEGLGFISNEKGNNWKALLVWVSTVRRSEQQVFLDLDTFPCIWNTSRLCSHGGLGIFCMPLSQNLCEKQAAVEWEFAVWQERTVECCIVWEWVTSGGRLHLLPSLIFCYRGTSQYVEAKQCDKTLWKPSNICIL